MRHVLEVRDVFKSFGDNEVLAGVSLDVNQGEVVVLIGSSGSGKSTLLRCIDLLEQVDDGQIWLNGDDITDPRVNPDKVRGRMGMVFQQFNLFPHLNVLHNITLSLRHVTGQSAAEANARAHELLERVGLAHKAQVHPDQLSGGQQQRVALARALACRPEVLLLDEITSALDPELVGEVLELVRSVKAEGATIVMATHEMAFARDIADRVCFLDAGRIVETGSAAQVFGNPRDPRTREFLKRFNSTPQ